MWCLEPAELRCLRCCLPISPAGVGPSRIVQVPSEGTREVFVALLAAPPERVVTLLRESPEMALAMLEVAAKSGLAAAQVQLGRMLLDGGVAAVPDYDAAFEWFSRAAALGNIEAANMLGRCFENGWGVGVDFSRAAGWFRVAAERGDGWAQYNLGHLYLNGQGVLRDVCQAVGWYRAASDQGHPRALNLMGRCYEQGWGVPRDLAAATEYYRASAEAGYFRGQFNFAAVLMEQQRFAEARCLFRRAIRQAPPNSRAMMMQAVEARWPALCVGDFCLCEE
jgi:TPR repeat protein